MGIGAADSDAPDVEFFFLPGTSRTILAKSSSGASPNQFSIVLSTLSYKNDADEPASNTRYIDFKVNPKVLRIYFLELKFLFRQVFSGGMLTAYNISVAINPINDHPPVVDLTGSVTVGVDYNVTYVEEAGPVRLSSNLTITDADTQTTPHTMDESIVAISDGEISVDSNCV